MTAVHPYDRATVDSLRACGIHTPLLERVENLAVEASAGRELRAAEAEANHPARLLGVAQAAIRDALLLDDVAEIHAQLADALARIKPTEVSA